MRRKLAQLAWLSDVREAKGDWTEIARRLEKAEPSEGYELCAAHGDLAPWNARRGKRRLWLFDWEQFAEEAPAFLDPVHFFLRREMLLRGRGAAESAGTLMKFLKDSCSADDPDLQACLVLAYWRGLGTVFAASDLDSMARRLVDG